MGATQKLLRFGVFELNLDTVELRKSGVIVRLPPQPFKLLVLLASHAGQLVTREEIETQLWGDETNVDFEHGVNKCIKQIRTVLGDDADHPLYIETLPRQGYRFLAPVVSKTIAAPGPRVVESQSGERGRTPALSAAGPMPSPIAGATAPAIAQPQAAVVLSPDEDPSRQLAGSGAPGVKTGRRMVWFAIAVLVLAGAAVAAFLYWRAHSRPVLTEKDTIVIADFDNKTGDTVFDDALKQAMAIQLEQSPFLNVLSDSKVIATLKLMNRPASERLTAEVAREVCQRSNSKAMLGGWITALGNNYVIGVKAIDCLSGDVLADEQATASGKEKVLNSLDAVTSRVRNRLGESLSSVQRFATPLSEASTTSLEALKAYSWGRKIRFSKGDPAALPFYQRAVELDPNFAMAYVAISTAYTNLAEAQRAAENARKAYDLRAKVTDRERFFIESNYYMAGTGELEKAARVYELWQQTYPRDDAPRTNLGFVDAALGNWSGALEQAREAMRLEPNDSDSYVNLGNAYVSLNRLDDAEVVYQDAEQRKLGSELLLANRYQLAFLKGDANQMAQFAAAGTGQPGTEDELLAMQADTMGWHGRFKNAYELTKRAMDSARQNDAKETAATYQAMAALREVEAGNREQAAGHARAALELAANREVQAMGALALARAGDLPAAEKLAEKLNASFPLDTLVQRYWLPTIKAAVMLQRKDPTRALELLKVTDTVELSVPAEVIIALCPIYLRGQAYLALHDGKDAAAEFQKFIDHYGIVGNFPWGAMARLGLARAYAIEAETDPAARDNARAAYQNFLRLWRDADPDLPIYKQAKAEYAKLQ